MIAPYDRAKGWDERRRDANGHRRRSRRSSVLRIEALEDRLVLSSTVSISDLTVPQGSLMASVTGSLAPGQQANVYRFSASAGETVDLTNLSTTSTSPTWTIYGPDGHALPGGTSIANELKDVFTTDGTYELVLSGSTATRVDYTFHVAASSPTATTLDSKFGQVQSGTITAGKYQSFTFTAPAGQTLLFQRSAGREPKSPLYPDRPEQQDDFSTSL
jgi:hypothetical protein